MCFLWKGMICFLLLFPFSPSFAENDNSCPSLNAEIDIDNKVVPYYLVFNYELTASQLGSRPLRIDGSGIEGSLKISFDRTYRCPKKASMEIVLSFNPIVSVAKEYPEGTEVYDYAQWYGNEYADIAVKNTKQFLPVIKEDIGRFVAELPVPSFNTEEEANRVIADIRRKIEEFADTRIKELDALIRHLQADFVTEEEKTPLKLAAAKLASEKAGNENGSRNGDFKGMTVNISRDYKLKDTVNNSDEMMRSRKKLRADDTSELSDPGFWSRTDADIGTSLDKADTIFADIRNHVKKLLNGIGDFIADIDKNTPVD